MRKKRGEPAGIAYITKLMIAVMCAATVIIASAAFPMRRADSGMSLQEFSDALDKRVGKLMKIYDIPGAVIAVIRDGRTQMISAYGYADIGKSRRITEESYMRVESITKSLTAWGVLKLEEDGLIDIDEPAERYIRNWAPAAAGDDWEKVTVRQLLSHTAGFHIGDFMERYDPFADKPSLKENLTEEASFINPPGKTFSYSNVGYNILELLIEEATGLEYSEYMENEILGPLGMVNSTYSYDEDIAGSLPFGHNTKGEQIDHYVYPYKASGGLLSTAGDIALFAAAQMTKFNETDVLGADYISKAAEGHADDIGVYGLVFDSYGYGCYIERLKDGSTALAHGGQGAGWMSHYQIVPETGDGIVILTNSQRSWPFFSYIVGDWGAWCGLPEFGLENIVIGIRAAIILAAVIWVMTAVRIFNIVRPVFVKDHRINKENRTGSGRILRVLLFAMVFIGLIWCQSREYLMIASIYPIASSFLGLSLLCASAIFALPVSALPVSASPVPSKNSK